MNDLKNKKWINDFGHAAYNVFLNESFKMDNFFLGTYSQMKKTIVFFNIKLILIL